MASGGSRPGSGRKAASQETKRVQVSLSVSPQTKKRIEELRKQNVKVGQVVDDLIGKYLQDKE